MGSTILLACKRTIYIKIALAVLFLLCTMITEVQAGDQRIVVFMSSNAAPYKDVLKGFHDCLSGAGLKAEYDVFNLKDGKDKAGQAIQAAKKGGVSLLFTLGSIATNMALKQDLDVPIVASMVMGMDTLERADNATGVSLEFSLETQFDWLTRLLPEARNIGVIYNPADNQESIDAADRIAKEKGLRLNAQEVSTPSDLPGALKRLGNSADVLWGIPDKLVFNPRTSKHILLFSFRNRIPYLGISVNWVKAGALYALSWDYKDIGIQSGEMAQKIILGVQPGSIPPASPRKVLYSLNLKTAKKMKVNIPEELVRDAQNVFKE